MMVGFLYIAPLFAMASTDLSKTWSLTEVMNSFFFFSVNVCGLCASLDRYEPSQFSQSQRPAPINQAVVWREQTHSSWKTIPCWSGWFWEGWKLNYVLEKGAICWHTQFFLVFLLLLVACSHTSSCVVLRNAFKYMYKTFCAVLWYNAVCDDKWLSCFLRRTLQGIWWHAACFLCGSYCAMHVDTS